jgi:hypothetical protein
MIILSQFFYKDEKSNIIDILCNVLEDEVEEYNSKIEICPSGFVLPT